MEVESPFDHALSDNNAKKGKTPVLGLTIHNLKQKRRRGSPTSTIDKVQIKTTNPLWRAASLRYDRWPFYAY